MLVWTSIRTDFELFLLLWVIFQPSSCNINKTHWVSKLGFGGFLQTGIVSLSGCMGACSCLP